MPAMKLATIVMPGLVGLCLTVSALGDVDPRTHAYGKFGYGHVTPHVPWAKPWVKGTLKVLIVAPIWTQRESVELWQRMDIDVVPLMTFKPKAFAQPGKMSGDSDWAPEEMVMKAMDQALAADWKVAVIGKSVWEKYPEKLRQAVLSRVSDAGAGLVLVEPMGTVTDDLQRVLSAPRVEDKSGFFRYATGWTELPYLREMKMDDVVSLREYGKGRVVCLRYDDEDKVLSEDGMGNLYTTQSLTPSAFVYSPGRYRSLSPDYEYYMSLVARAVLWAGRNESYATVEKIELPTDPLVRSAGEAQQLVGVHILNNSPRPHEANIRWTIRDLFSRVVAQGRIEARLNPGTVITNLPLPALPGGTHYLELCVCEGDRALDWAVHPLQIEAPCRVEGLATDRFGVEPNQPITGTFQVTGEIPPKAKVSVELTDTLGRLLDRVDAVQAGNPWRFQFAYPDRKTLLHIAEVKVTDDRGVVASGRTTVALPERRDIDDFTMSIWTGRNNEPMELAKLNRLREYGVDAISPAWYPVVGNISDISENALYLAQANMRFHGYMFVQQGGQAYLEKRYLWSASEPKGSATACYLRDTPWLAELLTSHRKTAAALAPYGQAGAFFNEEGNLDWYERDVCCCQSCLDGFRKYVQESYGTIAALNASWDAQYKDWPEVMPATRAEVKANGHFPAWADHRRFMELSYTRHYTNVVDEWHETDSYSRSGWGYCPGAGRESDTGFDRALYAAHGRCYWAQDSEPEGVLAQSFMRKGQLTQLIDAYSVWEALAWGMNGEFFYGENATFTPTLDEPLPADAWGHFGRKHLEWQEIKHGIGKYAINVGLADDGVRLYYTPMSVHASILNRTETSWENSLLDFNAALRHAGIGFRCFSYLQLEKGELTYPDIKVLILPFSQALSKKEADAISNFARAGGTVIADFSPGVLDEHCRKLPQGQLAELFPTLEAGAVQIVGKGKAACIGGMVKGYAQDRLSGVGGGKVQALVELCRGVAGIEPRTCLTHSSGTEFHDALQAHFPSGKTDCVILLREDEKKEPAEVSVKFVRPGHLYDVRQKKYLGQANSTKVVLSSRQPVVLACLPERLTDVQLFAKRTDGRKLAWTAQVVSEPDAGELRVLHVTLHSPSGDEMPLYAQNVIAKQGQCDGTVTLPLNELPGEYTLRAEEVFTGLGADLKFQFLPLRPGQ